MTWLGGTGGVSKSDWQSLFLRDVIIWPDNDVAGFKAAEEIVSRLRRIGVKSLECVAKEMFIGMPPKWDLADPLPEGKTYPGMRDILLNASEVAVGLPELISGLPAGQKDSIVSCLTAVLWRVEERIRPNLELED